MGVKGWGPREKRIVTHLHTMTRDMYHQTPGGDS